MTRFALVIRLLHLLLLLLLLLNLNSTHSFFSRPIPGTCAVNPGRGVYGRKAMAGPCLYGYNLSLVESLWQALLYEYNLFFSPSLALALYRSHSLSRSLSFSLFIIEGDVLWYRPRKIDVQLNKLQVDYQEKNLSRRKPHNSRGNYVPPFSNSNSAGWAGLAGY